MPDCECLTVKLYETEWHCMQCFRRFIPVDICGKCPESQAEPQEDIEEAPPG